MPVHSPARRPPAREPLTPRLLAYDAAGLDIKATIRLFRDLMDLPFDAFAVLPLHYRKDRDRLQRGGHL